LNDSFTLLTTASLSEDITLDWELKLGFQYEGEFDNVIAPLGAGVEIETLKVCFHFFLALCVCVCVCVCIACVCLSFANN